jgi:regulator of protease activity HflC (stomatin/prohibitin superfamily)
MLYSIKILEYERGLRFDNGQLVGVLGPGRHTYWAPLRGHRVDKVSVQDAWFYHDLIDVIAVKRELLSEVEWIEVTDTERALVWIDGRFASVLGPGRHAMWKVLHEVRVEIVGVNDVRFQHAQLVTILNSAMASRLLQAVDVKPGFAGLFYVDGELREALQPGRYAYWKSVASVEVKMIDRRESSMDIPGQEIMTSDKVSLRLNAQVGYRVNDPVKSIESVTDAKEALYRVAQLALRATIGTRELDALLAEKDSVAAELLAEVRKAAADYGIDVLSLGIRDIILPGEMKQLLNQVTEAKKAAEAALITRREEVAGMRSQANAAKILDNNPTLMRMRELEVLERIAESSNMNIVLGEKGLADRVAHLL